MKVASLYPLLAAGLLLTGCAMTPESRIARDPAGFAALPLEQQEKVRTGQVSVGFDPAAVRLAMGEPDRVVARESVEGNSEVWIYYAIVPGFHNGGYCVPNFPYQGPSYFCRTAAVTQYEERLRVSFQDGQVVTVDRAR